MPKSFQFFHIGLPKCASTSLQALWATDANCTFILLKEAAKHAREITLSSGPDAKSFPKLNIKTPNNDLKKKCIGSSEGLTWAFLDAPDLQGRLPDYHRSAARLLGGANATEDILITVRNPIDWIKSAHGQHIKTGGHKNMTDYLTDNENFVRGTLDLEVIVSAWQKHFPNITIIPLEHLVRDQEYFWQRYENSLKTSRPTRANEVANIKKNHTPSEDLPDIASLNLLLENLQKHYEGLKGLDKDFPNEWESHPKTLAHLRKWMPRRISEYGERNVLREITGNLEKPDPQTFQDIELPRELSNHLLSQYVDALREYSPGDEDLADEYRDSILHHTAN